MTESKCEGLAPFCCNNPYCPVHGQPEKMLKVADVAKMFNVQPATVREWLKDGTLTGIKIGGGHYWRIPESAARELANKRYGADDA